MHMPHTRFAHAAGHRRTPLWSCQVKKQVALLASSFVAISSEVTRHGTPIEPRNFLRSWDARCAKAGAPKITVHDGRRSRASLLVDPGVHPLAVCTSPPHRTHG
jgi:integrase